MSQKEKRKMKVPRREEKRREGKTNDTVAISRGSPVDTTGSVSRDDGLVRVSGVRVDVLDIVSRSVDLVSAITNGGPHDMSITKEVELLCVFVCVCFFCVSPKKRSKMKERKKKRRPSLGRRWG